ncbi:MAG: hypothetical protein L6Q35_15995, partial [Phycisphaerales bacterium]|nr:hypothetical protein [Phycisphaerales bacterium]
MPKPLPPAAGSSSPVSRLLDASAVSRAVGPVPATDPAQPSAAPSKARRPAHPVKREVVLTEHTAEVLDVLVDRLRAATRTRLSASHLVRALVMAVEPSLAGIEVQVASTGPWRLPANGARHDADRAEFERRMAESFIAA